ncbi:MAG: TIGR02147 family protein [Chitinispirillaceae bacterium]|nr:TIGR02147 family protein [Chitinispirillaceae bacterium]
MRPVKEYFEYREYLRDVFEEKKKECPYFSYRFMGKKVSTDASHLVKIFQKQRHIGRNSIEVFITFCDLKGSDAEYFSTLVHFNKSTSDRDSRFYYEKLLALKGVAAHALEKSQYEFYTKWYYSAVLTLLDFYPFRADYKALASKVSPPITIAKARKTISLLKELGLIKRKPGGPYYLTNKIITTGNQCRSIAVKAFQEETIRLAAEALHRHPKEKRNISTVTITIAEKNLDGINEMIKEFREALLNYAEAEKSPDKVYQLNIQLFPLTI